MIGTIVTATVDELSAYGAFVTISTGEKGMVHISEVDTKYVKDISKFLKKDQQIDAYVLEKKGDKYSLSIKKVILERKAKRITHNFDDKLSAFMKKSEQKQSELKRNIKTKQGIKKRKKKRI